MMMNKRNYKETAINRQENKLQKSGQVILKLRGEIRLFPPKPDEYTPSKFLFMLKFE